MIEINDILSMQWNHIKPNYIVEYKKQGGKLPTSGIPILTFRKYMNVFEVLFYHREKNMFYNIVTDESADDIVAWMYIPELKEED